MTNTLQLRSTTSEITTIKQAINSASPILAYVRNDAELKKGFLQTAYKACYNFLLLMDMDEERSKLIAETFALDVLETRDTWKPEDVVMFFKTVRQRQDIPEFKNFGNKITILKLNEMVAVYEGIRADELVEVQKEKSLLQISEGIPSERSGEWAQKITDRLGKKKEVSMERAVEVQSWHRENEAKEKELRVKMEKGEITEDEYLTTYNQFLIR